MSEIWDTPSPYKSGPNNYLFGRLRNLMANLTGLPTATLDETALGRLQLRFEAPKDVKLKMLSRGAVLSGNTSL